MCLIIFILEKINGMDENALKTLYPYDNCHSGSSYQGDQPITTGQAFSHLQQTVVFAEGCCDLLYM